MILDTINSKCPEESSFYDLNTNDAIFSTLNPHKNSNRGHIIRFSTKNND